MSLTVKPSVGKFPYGDWPKHGQFRQYGLDDFTFAFFQSSGKGELEVKISIDVKPLPNG